MHSCSAPQSGWLQPSKPDSHMEQAQGPLPARWSASAGVCKVVGFLLLVGSIFSATSPYRDVTQTLLCSFPVYAAI